MFKFIHTHKTFLIDQRNKYGKIAIEKELNEYLELEAKKNNFYGSNPVNANKSKSFNIYQNAHNPQWVINQPMNNNSSPTEMKTSTPATNLYFNYPYLKNQVTIPGQFPVMNMPQGIGMPIGLSYMPSLICPNPLVKPGNVPVISNFNPILTQAGVVTIPNLAANANLVPGANNIKPANAEAHIENPNSVGEVKKAENEIVPSQNNVENNVIKNEESNIKENEKEETEKDNNSKAKKENEEEFVKQILKAVNKNKGEDVTNTEKGVNGPIKEGPKDPRKKN